jgi:spore maturation protein CgeB
MGPIPRRVREFIRVKFTIFGLTLSSSWGNGHATPYRSLIRALRAQGHQVSFFERDNIYYARHRDFTACDYCDLRIYPDWETARKSALAAAAESDAVITASYLSEGARINDEVLALTGPTRVFYDLDTPVTLGNLSKADTEYLRADQIPGFDLYLSFTGGEILRELKRTWGARTVAPLYGSVDPQIHKRIDVPKPYHCAFSYMGTYAADRQGKVEELFLAPAARMPGEVFVLAGSLYPYDPKDGSPQFPCPQNVRRFPHVGPGDHAALYSSSRAALNITRAEMAAAGWCPSGRLFEAAACQTPLVTDTWQGLRDFFAADELFEAQNAEDVLRVLALPEEELARVAKRARQRTLDEHTGAQRARELISVIEAASGTRSSAAEAVA